MPFTEEELRQWHEEKRKREYRPASPWLAAFGLAAICNCCRQPFESGDGKINVRHKICNRCVDASN